MQNFPKAIVFLTVLIGLITAVIVLMTEGLKLYRELPTNGAQPSTQIVPVTQVIQVTEVIKPTETKSTIPSTPTSPASQFTSTPQPVVVYAQQTDGEALVRWCNNDWLTCRTASAGNARWEGLSVSTIGATYDSKGYTIERAFLFFDTSHIPLTAKMTSAILYVYTGQYLNGNKTIHVASSQAEIPLSSSDYSRVKFLSGGSVTFSSPFTWSDITLSEAAFDWIIKGGITKLALVHDNDLKDIAPTEANNVLISTAEDQSHAPYLLITYTLP